MIVPGIAANKERAAELLDISRMLWTKSYKKQLTNSLPNCSWKIAYEIMDTGAGLKFIKLEAMDPSWIAFINFMEQQAIGFAANTPLQSRECPANDANWTASGRYRSLRR